MRIVHVTCVFPPYRGGIGTAVQNLAKAQVQQGNFVTVFTPRYKDRDFFFDTHHGGDVETLVPLVSFGNAAILLQLLWRLRQYDIVHLHYPFFGAAIFVALAKLIFRMKMKLVIWYHMDVVGSGWKGLLFFLHRKLVMSFILNRADRIIISTEDYLVTSHASSVFRKLSDRVVVVPFGVDTDRFIPGVKDKEILSRFQLSFDTPLVLFVGGLDSAHYFKGLEYLIQAFAQLKDQRSMLFVVGQRGNMEAYYKKLATNVGLKKRVLFVGTVNDDELVKFYQTCDIFVLPSIDRSEAFGIVYLEAAACGKPVIGTNLPGVRTVIQDGHDGYIVPVRDVSALAEKMEQLISDPHSGQIFGINGRNKVLAKYQWPTIARRILQIYENI